MLSGYVLPLWRIRRRVALRLLVEAQNHMCAICGGHLVRRVQKTEAHWGPSVDHVIPVSRGGPDRLGNYLAAHIRCNTEKADRWPTGCELILLMAVNAKLGVSGKV